MKNKILRLFVVLLLLSAITMLSISHRMMVGRDEGHRDPMKSTKDAFLLDLPRRNSNATVERHAVTAETNETISYTSKDAERSPSVDYFACCGAGHRLSKMADAHYLAKHLGFGLRAFFGFCGKQEIFSYLFGSQPLKELQKMATASPDLILRVNNDVTGFFKLRRDGESENCRCPIDRMDEDARFYSSIRNRFSQKRQVLEFVQNNFSNESLTIGMHLRLGNGELGDFQQKNRGVSDPRWFRQMADRLIEMTKSLNGGISSKSTSKSGFPTLFLASDTQHAISSFARLLQDHMTVVSFSQERPEEGSGVLFGQTFHASAREQEDICLLGWQNSYIDMMILSYSDVLIAARPSSFTQSLPMSLVLSKDPSLRKVPKSYCEVDAGATRLWCFKDVMDWCCSGKTDFSLSGIQRYDYLRMPDMSYFGPNSSEAFLKVTVRPRLARECIPTPKYPARQCLPYSMPDRAHVEEEGNMADVIKMRRRKKLSMRKKRKVKGGRRA